MSAAVEEIKAGEAFQIVVSQRFEVDTTADALDIYRMLRLTNPSPYMYLLRLDGFDIVGSSPEALVTVQDDVVVTHPIAGSKPRGATPAEDAALEAELLADPKERAEHVMLVDLGRNDLGRVCRPGTVEVVEFMEVRRYSHIMHLESTVTGRLDPERTALDAVLAAFPAGTLSGAPKVRAMEIIDGLEVSRRGLYGGVVGYLDLAGDADAAIAIRTALLRDGVAYVQAGGGIVADSHPPTEDQESRTRRPRSSGPSPSPRPSGPCREPAVHDGSDGRGPTLVVLLVGAGVGFVAAAQPWWRASGAGAAVTFSGSDATGGLSQALAAVTLAGVLLVLVLRRRGRRVLAVVLAATGLGMIATGALQTAPDAEAVRNRVRQVSLTDQFALTTSAWPWVYAFAGLLVVIGALLLWVGAARWAERSDRFARSVDADGRPGGPERRSEPGLEGSRRRSGPDRRPRCARPRCARRGSNASQWSGSTIPGRNEDQMADTAPKFYEVSDYRPAPGDKHVHHGRTVAAWVGSLIALIGFIVGGLGLVFGNWTVFWIGGALLIVALIATVVLQKMGMGAV